MDAVRELEADTDKHLEYTDTDGQLHLEGIQEQKFVAGAVPGGINSEGVRATELAGVVLVLGVEIGGPIDVTVNGGLLGPTSGEKRDTQREDIVVHETSIGREESHKQNKITGPGCTLHGFVLALFHGVGVHAEVATDEEQTETMSNITIHDTEEEGEGHDSEERRVGLAIAGNTVGVHKFLEGCGELVGFDVGRGHGLGGRVDHKKSGGSLAGRLCLEQILDALHLRGGDPRRGAEGGGAFEKVEGGVDVLLLGDEQSPLFNLRARLLRAILFDKELHLLTSAGLEGGKDLVLVLNGVVKLDGALGGQGLCGWVGVQTGLEGLTQTLDLGGHGSRSAALEEDGETGLRRGVLNLTVARAEDDVGITTGGTEDRLGKTLLVDSADDTRDVGERQAVLIGLLAAILEQSGIEIAGGVESSARGGGDGSGERLASKGHDLQFFLGLGELFFELFIVATELGEMVEVVLKLLLEAVKSVLALEGEEVLMTVLHDLVLHLQFGDHLSQEADVLVHLVATGHVLLVRTIHGLTVHVINLKMAFVTERVEHLASLLKRQHQGAPCHWFRT